MIDIGPRASRPRAFLLLLLHIIIHILILLLLSLLIFILSRPGRAGTRRTGKTEGGGKKLGKNLGSPNQSERERKKPGKTR